MIRTEDAAKQSFCPYRMTSLASAQAQSAALSLSANLTLASAPIIDPSSCLCLGSGCMAWRLGDLDGVQDGGGYCGLAGKP